MSLVAPKKTKQMPEEHDIGMVKPKAEVAVAHTTDTVSLVCRPALVH